MVDVLTEHLHGCGYSDALVTKALETFEKAANDSTKSFMTVTGRCTNCCVTA